MKKHLFLTILLSGFVFSAQQNIQPVSTGPAVSQPPVAQQVPQQPASSSTPAVVGPVIASSVPTTSSAVPTTTGIVTSPPANPAPASPSPSINLYISSQPSGNPSPSDLSTLLKSKSVLDFLEYIRVKTLSHSNVKGRMEYFFKKHRNDLLNLANENKVYQMDKKLPPKETANTTPVNQPVAVSPAMPSSATTVTAPLPQSQPQQPQSQPVASTVSQNPVALLPQPAVLPPPVVPTKE